MSNIQQTLMTTPVKSGGKYSDDSSDDEPLMTKHTKKNGGLVVIPIPTPVALPSPVPFVTANKFQETKAREAKLHEISKDPKFGSVRDKIVAFGKEEQKKYSAKYTVGGVQEFLREVTENHDNVVIPDFLRSVAQLIPQDTSAAVRGELSVVTQVCVAGIDRVHRENVKPFEKILKRLREQEQK